MRRPHAVIFPYPSSGFINPALQIARLLHSQGFFVTFVNTEFSHKHLLSIEGSCALPSHDDFRFESIPDGFSSSEYGIADYGLSVFRSIQSSCAAPLKDLILKLNSLQDVPPVTCVIACELLSFVIDVAKELNVTALMFWGTSAAGFVGSRILRDLKERGYLPLKDESCLNTEINWIAGMPGVLLGDISSFVRTTDANDELLNLESQEASNCSKADGLILNTFDHLESEVLNALKDEFCPLYTIGPLPALQQQHVKQFHDSAQLSLRKPDMSCTEWLDKQSIGSVLYVSFGSLTVLTQQQLTEFALGLAGSDCPFLWIIRDDHKDTVHVSALTQELFTKTKENCYIATWCVQEQVLHHPSVGGFLTHSGWNSTMESIWAGVPMICWPGFADQYMNCRYVCDKWGIGLRMDEEVKRDQVKELVKELMQGKKGKDMRKNAADWKKKTHEAVAMGGSSYGNFQTLVEDLSFKNL